MKRSAGAALAIAALVAGYLAAIGTSSLFGFPGDDHHAIAEMSCSELISYAEDYPWPEVGDTFDDSQKADFVQTQLVNRSNEFQCDDFQELLTKPAGTGSSIYTVTNDYPMKIRGIDELGPDLRRPHRAVDGAVLLPDRVAIQIRVSEGMVQFEVFENPPMRNKDVKYPRTMRLDMSRRLIDSFGAGAEKEAMQILLSEEATGSAVHGALFAIALRNLTRAVTWARVEVDRTAHPEPASIELRAALEAFDERFPFALRDLLEDFDESGRGSSRDGPTEAYGLSCEGLGGDAVLKIDSFQLCIRDAADAARQLATTALQALSKLRD